MIHPLKSRPKLQRFYFLFLLPVFFVLHGYAENFGFISAQDAFLLTASYCTMSAAILLFSYFFFRNWSRAALITAFWMAVFFFFGAFHDFMKQHSPVHLFSRYIFLLPACILLLVWLFIFLKKTAIRFQRFSTFLNILLIVYIVVDLVYIGSKAISPKKSNVLNSGFSSFTNIKLCDTCSKPDIYFLLLDEYASTISLKEKYNHQNSIDEFLASKGFSIQEKSFSNYNFTVASMAAIMNMSYVQVIENVKAVTAEDYGKCDLLLRDNNVIRLLDAQGYEIVNYSIFNLAGHPTRVKQSFLPLQTRLITERTLFARMNKDIGWILMVTFPFNKLSKDYFLRHLKNDSLFLNLTKTAAHTKQDRPRFIYTHLNIPHAPYYFDKNLKRKDNSTVIAEYKANPSHAYLDYLNYTNVQLTDLVNTIQANNPDAVIIIMGDHGFRKKIENSDEFHYFQNLNAVYFPDRDYRNFYDSISGVNQFRVVFNKLFGQSFPLLKDSSILLQDKIN